MGSQIALGIVALVLLLQVNTLQVERLDGLRLGRGQLSFDPHEGTARIHFFANLFGGHSYGSGEQVSHHGAVFDFRRHRKGRLHRNTHSQRMHVAVKNDATLGVDVDGVALLTGGAGKIFAVKK